MPDLTTLRTRCIFGIFYSFSAFGPWLSKSVIPNTCHSIPTSYSLTDLTCLYLQAYPAEELSLVASDQGFNLTSELDDAAGGRRWLAHGHPKSLDCMKNDGMWIEHQPLWKVETLPKVKCAFFAPHTKGQPKRWDPLYYRW